MAGEAAPPEQGLALSTAALGDPAFTSIDQAASDSQQLSHLAVAEGRAVLSPGLGRGTGVFRKQFIPLWMGLITLPPSLIIQAVRMKILVADCR